MIRRLVERAYRSLPVVRELMQVRDALRHEIGTLRALHLTQLLEFEAARHPRYGDPRRLVRYGHQVHSQGGVDGVLHEIFRRIGETDRVFAEIGVGDGTENNTAFLLARGWSGFWIDSSAAFRRTLAAHGVGSDRLRGEVAFVRRETIGPLFAKLGIPAEFDLLSIDVDQNTYYVWEGLKEYRPRVVAIEYNAAIPADVDWKVRYDADRVWDETQNFGASLKALELLGRERGYALVGCDFAGTDAFFVREDLVGDRFLPPYTAENHYEPVRYQLLHRWGHRRGLLDLPAPAPRRRDA
ncbi:MAG TPA: hypothetical protein VFT32_00980 [Candidatus Eisenbacteria bacterium]|nr:hypothetical protein [Candidatus Eisenbacteria bacterium]